VETETKIALSLQTNKEATQVLTQATSDLSSLATTSQGTAQLLSDVVPKIHEMNFETRQLIIDQEMRLSTMIATNQANTQQMIIQMVDANKEQMQAAIIQMGSTLGETMANILATIKDSHPSTPKRTKKGVRIPKQTLLTFNYTPPPQETSDGIHSHRPQQQHLHPPQELQAELVEL
jgi:hypothetical protein